MTTKKVQKNDLYLCLFSPFAKSLGFPLTAAAAAANRLHFATDFSSSNGEEKKRARVLGRIPRKRTSARASGSWEGMMLCVGFLRKDLILGRQLRSN